MDDDGYLRKPTWLRAWPVEDRYQFAKVPKVFRDYMTEASRPPDPQIGAWLDEYERGQILMLRHINTSKVAPYAAYVLGELLRRGESGRWITSEGYVELYKEEWADGDQGSLWRQLKYIARGFDVLVLDGLGEEPNTEFERKILGSLIKGRYERGKTTIITTPNTAQDMHTYGRRTSGYIAEGKTISYGRQ